MTILLVGVVLGPDRQARMSSNSSQDSWELSSSLEGEQRVMTVGYDHVVWVSSGVFKVSRLAAQGRMRFAIKTI